MPPIKQGHLVLANGATAPKDRRSPLVINYLEGSDGQRFNLAIPAFVSDLYHIPERHLDLLEIAGYVFAIDRLLARGDRAAVEYQSWSRSIDLHTRVRDHEFWSQPGIQDALTAVFQWLSGDREIVFKFQPGHSTPPTNLFDALGFSIPQGNSPVAVSLFSGGLDSLAGVADLLEDRERTVMLVSHQSAPQITRTQRALAEGLRKRYGDRVRHIQFKCSLRDRRGRDENQRTRSFLYASIAFAVAKAYKLNHFDVYENGVTSVNLYRREDLMNARASRTTHPRTIAYLTRVYSLIADSQFEIRTPFLYETKTDVVARVKNLCPDLISSSVSCSKTFKIEGQATHCGECVQCLDRRFAVYAAEAEEHDGPWLYEIDFVRSSSGSREAKTTIVDYLRQAKNFARWPVDRFEQEYSFELGQTIEHLPGPGSDEDRVLELHRLCQSHARAVAKGIKRIRELYEDVFEPLPEGCLLQLVGSREYLKSEVQRLADSIADCLTVAVPEMFASERPKDEPDLNAKVGAILRTHEPSLKSEHPVTSFACAASVPDHTLQAQDLLIEAKYIRDKTSPSKANEGIAADLTKYPESCFILFLVYDPEHAIKIDSTFRHDIEKKGRNRILIVR